MSATSNPHEVMVLGAGIIGVCAALELQSRGLSTILVDQQEPGLGASFGNSGVIQREAVMPYAMPRDLKTLFATLIGQNTAARVHLSALPGLLPFFTRYWWHSSTENHRKHAKSYATLIERSVTAYEEMLFGTTANQYLAPKGIFTGYRNDKSLMAAAADADYAAQHFGINSSILDTEDAITQAIPHINHVFHGMIHFPDSVTVSDPRAMLLELFKKFKILGGKFVHANALALKPGEGSFSLIGNAELVTAKRAIIALGAHSPYLTRKLGIKFPMGVKRGYHIHFKQKSETPLAATMVDTQYGFVLTPKAQGIRLTTGAEFARPSAMPSPKQLDQTIPIAHTIFPLGAKVEKTPWMGMRPCMPDMLPVIGELPGYRNLWCAFGHGHQGLTLGPITAQLIADLITDQPSPVDPAPFSAARFA